MELIIVSEKPNDKLISSLNEVGLKVNTSLDVPMSWLRGVCEEANRRAKECGETLEFVANG